MSLTAAQVAKFREEGYLIVERFLPAATIERYRTAYMETVERLSIENALRNGAAADDSDAHEKVYQLRTAHMLHPAFDEHIRSPAFLDIVQALIGADIQLVHYQGLYKPPLTGGSVNWHQDDFYWPNNDSTEGSVSLWVPLDDATVDNGCMWYVPGSHKCILPHDQLWDPKQRKGFYYGIPSLPPEMERRAVAAEVPAGGIAIHAGSMVHCSRPNHSERPRRRSPPISSTRACAHPAACSRESRPRPSRFCACRYNVVTICGVVGIGTKKGAAAGALLDFLMIN